MKVFLLVAAALALTQAAPWASEDEAWEAFKVQFNRNYTPEEEAVRKAYFIQTHRNIVKHNSEGHSWTLAHNKFSDQSSNEKKRMFVPRLSRRTNKKRSDDNKQNFDLVTEDILCPQDNPTPKLDKPAPAEVDLRSHKCMPPVKNQGNCGSCWAFATTPPVEYGHCLKSGALTLLSEQQLVDCDNLINNGCNGGTTGFPYFRKFGAINATAYPYTGMKGPCKYSELTKSVVVKPTKCHSVTYIGGKPDAQRALAFFLKFGPLSTSLTLGNSFYKYTNYASGVYDPSDCAKGDGHAVVIVGYGKDAKSGKNYWILRNSWGADWGDKGYFKMRRGVNRCNIEEEIDAVQI